MREKYKINLSKIKNKIIIVEIRGNIYIIHEEQKNI